MVRAKRPGAKIRITLCAALLALGCTGPIAVDTLTRGDLRVGDYAAFRLRVSADEAANATVPLALLEQL